MSNVVFDYSALSDAKSYAKKVVTGWGCMDSYKDGIKGNFHHLLMSGGYQEKNHMEEDMFLQPNSV